MTPWGAVECRAAQPRRTLRIKRPIGSFIFLDYRRRKNGAARRASEFSFDDEKLMIRIDMSEYMESTACPDLSARLPVNVVKKKAGHFTEQIGVIRIRWFCLMNRQRAASRMVLTVNTPRMALFSDFIKQTTEYG